MRFRRDRHSMASGRIPRRTEGQELGGVRNAWRELPRKEESRGTSGHQRRDCGDAAGLIESASPRITPGNCFESCAVPEWKTMASLSGGLMRKRSFVAVAALLLLH